MNNGYKWFKDDNTSYFYVLLTPIVQGRTTTGKHAQSLAQGYLISRQGCVRHFGVNSCQREDASTPVADQCTYTTSANNDVHPTPNIFDKWSSSSCENTNSQEGCRGSKSARSGKNLYMEVVNRPIHQHEDTRRGAHSGISMIRVWEMVNILQKHTPQLYDDFKFNLLEQLLTIT